MLVKKVNFKQLRSEHLRFGEKGEKIGCDLLKSLGFDILQRNYHGPHGEIDIIARDQSVMCFVEVKTRHHSKYSRPADAVSINKRKNIINTAHRYLRHLGRPPIVYRFDIVEVIFIKRRITEVRYWPNEFSESGIDFSPNN